MERFNLFLHMGLVSTLHTGWQVVTNSAMKLMYRHESGSPVHCIKARADMEAPIEVRSGWTRVCMRVRAWSVSKELRGMVTSLAVLVEVVPVCIEDVAGVRDGVDWVFLFVAVCIKVVAVCIEDLA
eukprot:scaffold41757_cov18-Tisochrysis_lutea.AAC.5